MTRNHDKEQGPHRRPAGGHDPGGAARHEKGHVRSHLDIAMEKAKAMAHGAGAPARAAGAETATLRERAAKADEYYDRFLRAAADLENYKKRAERERDDLLKYGQEELMGERIVVLDNFDRALAFAGASPDAKGLSDGVSLIRKQLIGVLAKFGLKAVEAVGHKFDPEFHEAVAQVETDTQPEGTVVAEQLRGYTLNGRLLRPSVVTVAAAPKKEVAGGPPAGSAAGEAPAP